MLDENAMAAGRKFLGVSSQQVSPDGNKLAYLQDTTALRVYTLLVKDLRTGQVLSDTLSEVMPGLAWANDNRTIFYSTADSARRTNAVWRHVLGQPRSSDAKVFQDDDVLNNVNVGRSKSGKYVFISDDGFTSSEWRVVPTMDPTTAPRVIAPRRANVEYSVDHIDGAFLMVTNDGARNFKIVRIPENDFSPSKWTNWVPETDSVFIEGIEPFKRYVVVSERSGGLARLRVIDLATRGVHYVTFPEPAYGVFPVQNAEFDSQTLRFQYSSLLTPASTYDYDLATHQRVLKKRVEVPGYNPSQYEVKRLMVPVRDGVHVPVSMIVHKGWTQDASHPLLLYAYGSYGVVDRADVQLSGAEPRGSRLCVCDRAHPRRTGDGAQVVRRRQDDEQEEHVQ